MSSVSERLPSARRIVSRHGFTLLELVVVIAIIATLASIVAPSVFRNTGDAKVVAARTQIESLALALESYRLDVGEYPTNTEGLEALVSAPAATSAWRGPYLRRGLPLDPWGRSYHYEVVQRNGHDDYAISTLGKDGKVGGEGEDADISSGDSTGATPRR